MIEPVKHPDKITGAQVTKIGDKSIIILLECETADLADVIFQNLSLQIKNGNLAILDTTLKDKKDG